MTMAIKRRSEQTTRLERFLRKWNVEGAELEITEDGSPILIYGGARLLLKTHVIMSIDTMSERYHTAEMLHLPEFSYQLLVWLNHHGYDNQKFKYVEILPACWMCREHFHKEIPACYITKTRTGLQPMCPDHAVDYEVIQILIERN